MVKIKKIGVLGGAFNPPHRGHLILAKTALKKLRLDKIIFIPYGIPALKKFVLVPAKERLKMASLLVGKNPKFEVSDYEVKKKKISYTIDTVGYLKKKYTNSKIYWIIGEDSLREIIEEKWRGGLRVLDLAKFIVFSRPNQKFTLKKIKRKFTKNKKLALKKVIFVRKKVPISATNIRKKLKKGQNIEKLLPKKVLEYIKVKKLYV